MVTLLPPASPTKRKDGASPRYHWTVDSFYRAIAAGVFDEPKRLELVHGDLWEKEEVNPPHANLTEDIARLLRGILEPQSWVREEKPLHIANDGEPVPDILVATAEARQNRQSHPTNAEAVLVIEVADATVTHDTGEKAVLYAQAGIADYWVSVVGERVLLVFRNPTPNGYPPPLRLTDADTISPLAAPNITLDVRDLVAHPTLAPSASEPNSP